jgi:DNA polymerase (family 10)
MGNDLLRDLDIVIVGIHTGLDMDEHQMTERFLAALQNDCLDIIAHPTGRVLLQREPARFDLATVAKAAADRGVFLEINASPYRLDLPDTGCITARKHGARFAIGSDAGSREGLRTLDLGVATARRGWLTAAEVVNTLPLSELRRALVP